MSRSIDWLTGDQLIPWIDAGLVDEIAGAAQPPPSLQIVRRVDRIRHFRGEKDPRWWTQVLIHLASPGPKEAPSCLLTPYPNVSHLD